MSQDDGVYAYQAIQMSKGSFEVHPANVAYILPQSVLGATAVKLLFLVNPISVLNSLTWIVFMLLMLLFRSWSQLEDRLMISAFSFPLWAQYGVSFLYDMYAVFFVVTIISLIECKNLKFRASTHFGLFVLSILLILQLQSLCIIPLVLGLILRGGKGASLFCGLVTGLFIYQLLPQSLLQKAMVDFVVNKPIHLSSFLSNFFQSFLGLGLFLLPLLPDFKAWTKKGVLISLIGLGFFWSVLLGFSSKLIAVGVFFTDYLPRPFSAALLSMGFLGWFGIWDLIKQVWKTEGRYHPNLISLVLCLLGFFIPYSHKGIPDIRYSMVLFPLIVWVVREPLKARESLGNSLWFLLPMTLLSILLNSYNLDTTSARWETAKNLVDRGTSRDLISAGYGADVFFLESDCIKSALEKIPDKNLFSPSYRERVFQKIPRTYSDEWVPQFVIKPLKVFGKTMRLKTNRLAGQDETLESIITYQSLGLEHKLALFRNQTPRLAWCFRN